MVSKNYQMKPLKDPLMNRTVGGGCAGAFFTPHTAHTATGSIETIRYLEKSFSQADLKEKFWFIT